MDVTTGGWIQIGITLGGFLVALALWVHHTHFRPRQNYQMIFPVHDSDWPDSEWPPSNAQSRPYKRKLAGGGPKSLQHIAVYAHSASDINRVDIRFLQRRCFRLGKIKQWQRGRFWRLRFQWEEWQNDATIGIKSIAEDEKSDLHGDSIVKTEDNKAAGMRLFYKPSSHVLADDFLWFTIEIDAGRDWTGWISFEAAMADGRKARSHRRASIAATRQ